MKTRWLQHLAFASVAALCAGAGLVSADGGPTDLGTLPFGTVSVANSINDNGQVCGQASPNGGNPLHAALWAGGPAQDLGTLDGGSVSAALHINNVGQLSGYSNGLVDNVFRSQWPCVWRGGVIQPLPGLPGASRGMANAVNENGQVCGVMNDARTHAVLWEGGQATELPPLSGDTGAQAFGINNLGQACGISFGGSGGTHAVVWTNGAAQELPRPSGVATAVAYGINDSGQVCGYLFTNAQHAVLWSGGQPQDLGTLPGGTTSAPNPGGINQAGQVVGFSNGSVGGQTYSHAVAWSGGQVQDLGALPNPNNSLGVSLANGLNNQGQACGSSNPGTANHAVLFAVATADVTPPVVTAPADAARDTDPGACTASVNVGQATAADSVDGALPATGVRDDGKALTDPYPAGVTTITWSAKDTAGNVGSRVQKVTVTDREKPSLSCPPDVDTGTDPNRCYAQINVGTPTATDNCGFTQINGVRSDGKDLSADYPVGKTTITWTATDAAGNSTSCTQSVTVAARAMPVINCPAGVAVNNTPGQCSALVNPGQATVTDACPGTVISGARSDGKALTAPYPVGVTTITWTASDPYGNKSSCTQSVTVTDNEKPVVAAPADQSAGNDAGKCSAAVNVGQAAAADNCAVTSVSGVRSDGKDLGAPYPVGVTTVTWTAVDAAGNSASATQTVTVTDSERPTVVPGADRAVNTDAGKCSATVSLTPAGATDNCGVASVSGARSDGKPLSDPYPLGKTTVTWTATDPAGNSASANQSVTVTDAEAPVVAAPAPLSANTDAGKCSAAVKVSAPSATDNCGVPTVAGIRSDGKALSDAYPAGVTTITWTATDAAGNSSSAVQTVTVKDAEAPVISGASATPDWIFPPDHKMKPVTLSYSLTDNCDSNPTVTLSVTSSENANQEVEGDGDDGQEPQPADWQIIDAHHVMVRADRSGTGTGRVYFITITAVDASGNRSSRTVTVTIPKSRKK